jgi:putative endonuclease
MPYHATPSPRNPRSTKAVGDAGEAEAEIYLVEQGLEPVRRNFRCKAGEIDLILLDGETLVFVEVRLRTNPHCDTGAESITYRKQQKLIKAASWYLLKHPEYAMKPCRIDVVSLGNTHRHPRLEWIKNAIEVSY